MNTKFHPRRQRGAVLLIALVVLVAMTLSALALIRSVNTTNLVAGNLAFRESALLYAERATEHALAWLVATARSEPSKLWRHSGDDDPGYLAVREDPDPLSTDRKTWDALWNAVLKARKRSVPIVGEDDIDVTGNQVDYVIQRLCEREGSSKMKGDGGEREVMCTRPPFKEEGCSYVTPAGDCFSKQVYYRITARVAGPRNTVVYTQTIIAL